MIAVGFLVFLASYLLETSGSALIYQRHNSLTAITPCGHKMCLIDPNKHPLYQAHKIHQKVISKLRIEGSFVEKITISKVKTTPSNDYLLSANLRLHKHWKPNTNLKTITLAAANTFYIRLLKLKLQGQLQKVGPNRVRYIFWSVP